MKKGWQTKTLGEIGKISMCKRIFKEETTATGDIPFYKIGTFGKEPDAFIPNQTYNEYRSKYPFPKKGDVLISASGTIGRRVRYDGEPAYFQDSNIVWIVNDEKQVLNDYLYYFYGACEWNSTKGSTISRLYNDDLRRIAIGFPESLAEQQRIVGLLDEAFEGLVTAKANAEKNLQNARALFESHLHSVFTQRGNGWVETTLEKISTNLDSKRVPITKNVRSSGEYPYYGASGIVDYVTDYIFEGDNLLVSEDGANLLARSTPIAFSVSGKYWVNNHAHILHFENMATQRFAEFYLESIKLDDYITGAAQPKLNQKALNSIPIPIPKSVETQAKIVEQVVSLQKETQSLARIYERKLAALAELKKSLLHQAFTGEL